MRNGIIVLQNYSWIEEIEILSFNFFWSPSKSSHIFWNSFGLYFHLLGNWRTIPFDNSKWSKENFFHQMVKTTFFCCWFIFFMPNSSVFFLYWDDVKNPQLQRCINSLSDYMCAVLEISRVRWLALVYSSSVDCLGTRLVHTCVTLSGKDILYSHVGNFDTVFVCQQILNFTFGYAWEFRALHVLFYQSKYHLVNHFIHYCKCFSASPCRIYLSTNIQCIQASCLHCMHFVAACVWPMQKDSLPWENVSQHVLRFCWMHT